MLQNPEAEAFFLPLSAHSDVTSELLTALRRLGEYEIRYAPRNFGAAYAVTKSTLFCGAVAMKATYWRLRPKDVSVALATGAVRAPLGDDWVMIELFRSAWPRPDLPFWALRAYDFARTGQ
jgi:hypothetical protein